MGQESSVLRVEVDQDQIRKNDPSPHGLKKKKIKPKLDAFMKHVDVIDHIKPIKDSKKNKESEDTFESVFDLRKLLQGKPKIKKDDKELDENDLMDLPISQNSFEQNLSSSSSEEEDKGIYRHLVQHDEINQYNITHPEAHPVSIDGDLSVGSVLTFSDKSTYKNQFPCFLIEWFTSIEINETYKFSVVASGTGLNFTVPAEAVGKYIQVTASRKIEDQLSDTKYEHIEGGTYDPHIKTTQHVKYKEDTKIVDVVSKAIAGPILIADAWAYVILSALSKCGFSFAIKFRDRLNTTKENIEKLETSEIFSRIKVPGIMSVYYDQVEFKYLEDENELLNNNDLNFVFRLLNVENFVETNIINCKDSKMKKVVFRLQDLHFRPSKHKKTIVVALNYKKDAYKLGGTQDLVRVDVDPAVGRDVALYVLLSFQAAYIQNKMNPSFWTQAFHEGDIDNVKALVRQFLQDLGGRALEDEPAYHEVDIAN